MSLVTYSVDEQQLDRLTRIFSDTRDLVSSVVEQAVADAAPSALQAAQTYPRPAVHPFRWSLNPQKNERARRWYFAAIARGEINTDGTRYVRTNRFKNSFDARVEESSTTVDAVFGSDFDKASYVVGSADGDVSQIIGHERTGWSPFTNPAQQFEDHVIRNVDTQLPNAVEKALNNAS